MALSPAAKEYVEQMCSTMQPFSSEQPELLSTCLGHAQSMSIQVCVLGGESGNYTPLSDLHDEAAARGGFIFVQGEFVYLIQLPKKEETNAPTNPA